MDLERYNILVSMYKDSCEKTAILDKDLRAVWSNDERFFDEKFCLLSYTDEISSLPIEKITNAKITYKNLVFSSVLTPIYDEMIIEGYLCQLFDVKSSLDIISNTDFYNQIQNALGLFNNQLSRILTATDALDIKISEKKLEEEKNLINRQLYNCNKLYTELRNISDCLDNIFNKQPRSECIELSEIITELITQCSKHLKWVDRRLQFSYAENEHFYIEVPVSKLKIALLNLLQNSLLYSPKKSDIIIKLWNEAQFIYVSIENSGESILEFINSNSEKQLDKLMAYERLGLGLNIIYQCMAICNGEVYFTEGEGSGTISTLKIPLYKNTNQLRSKDSEYGSENFYPVKAFMNEIVESEK